MPKKFLVFRFRIALICLSAILGTKPFAGARISSINESYSNGKVSETQQFVLNIDKNKVAMESGKDHAFIYRQDKKLFWMIDKKGKSYTEMTEADLKKMAGQMDEAMQQMQEALKSLPPEQREMMEKMMKGQMPKAAKVEEIQYKKIAGSQKISSWTCNQFEGTQSGKKILEAWTTPPKGLGIEMQDVKVLEEMSTFFKKFAPNTPQLFQAKPQKNGLDGMPVRMVHYNNGVISTKTEVKEISKQNFDAAIFEVPTGFTKKNMGQ